MSGYDIKRFFERLDWLIGHSSFGNIYPTLHALLKDELVSVDVRINQGRPPKKVYEISQEGRHAMREWLKQPIPPNASRRAFVTRLILAWDPSEDGLIAHLEQRRAQVISHQGALQEMSDESEQAGIGWRLVLDYGLAVASNELDWLESLLSRIPEASFVRETVESTRVRGAG
jgi:DNA-binding PadR family transcriptional regulator